MRIKHVTSRAWKQGTQATLWRKQGAWHGIHSECNVKSQTRMLSLLLQKRQTSSETIMLPSRSKNDQKSLELHFNARKMISVIKAKVMEVC